MTRAVPGLAPDHDYEPSYCNQALLGAGLPVEQPNTLAMLKRTLGPYPESRFNSWHPLIPSSARRETQEVTYRHPALIGRNAMD